MNASLLTAMLDDGVVSSSLSSSLSHKFSSAAHHLKSRTYLLIRLRISPATTGPAISSFVYRIGVFSEEYRVSDDLLTD